MIKHLRSNPIYLDYAATTPVDERVVEKMMGFLSKEGNFGNPASVSHRYGHAAHQAVEEARGQVAQLISCDPKSIIWTSGATESNNLAIKGIALFYQRRGKHIITSKIEHKAVLDTCGYLEKHGFEVTYLTPNSSGLIEAAQVAAAMRPDTILVSLMHVNNEIGTIHDLEIIGNLCREKGIFFHVDAAQGAGKLPIDLRKIPVDLMSLSAHKIYGPKGIGALYIAQQPRIRLEAQIHGGGHELGMRSGTLPTHQIVGMGEAFHIAEAEMAADFERIKNLRIKLWNGLQNIQDLGLNVPLAFTSPYILNLHVDHVEGSSLLLALKDLAISAGSACNSATVEASYVLRAIGLTELKAHNSLRISLGRYTTESEIDYTVQHISETITWLRDLSPLWPQSNEKK